MEIRHRSRAALSHRSPKITVVVVGLFGLLLVAFLMASSQSESEAGAGPADTIASNRSSIGSRNNSNKSGRHSSPSFLSNSPIPVFYPEPEHSTSTFRKLQQELATAASAGWIEAIPLPVASTQVPPEILSTCGPEASQRYGAFLDLPHAQPHLALEILKYCALLHHGSGLYLDSSSSLMDTLDHLILELAGSTSTSASINLAVLNDPFVPSSIHSAILYFNPKYANSNRKLAQTMLDIFTKENNSMEELISNPTLLPRALYRSIAADAQVPNLTPGPNGNQWYLFQHSCTIQPLGGRHVTAPVSDYALQSYRYDFNSR